MACPTTKLCTRRTAESTPHLLGHPVLLLQLVDGRVVGPGRALLVGPPVVCGAAHAAADGSRRAAPSAGPALPLLLLVPVWGTEETRIVS